MHVKAVRLRLTSMAAVENGIGCDMTEMTTMCAKSLFRLKKKGFRVVRRACGENRRKDLLRRIEIQCDV